MRCPPRYHQRQAKAKEELISELSVAHALENEAAHKEIARLTSELADAKQLLAEERNATAAAVKAVEAAEAANANIRSEADVSQQAAVTESMELRSALSVALTEREATTSKLADVERLLAEERDATAAAITAMEVVNADARAARQAAAEKIEEADRTVVEQREAMESASENITSLTRSLEAKTATIDKLESALRAALTGEGAQQGWRLERLNVGGHGGQIGVYGKEAGGGVRYSWLVPCRGRRIALFPAWG